MNKLTITFLMALLSAATSVGQNAQQSNPVRAVPRMADGHVNLGTSPGEKGHWIRQGRAQLANNPESVLPAGPGGLSTNLKLEDVPFQPWARALYAYR